MRVLVVHPSIDVVGGAELVALHVVRYFQERYQADVTLLCLSTPDLDHIARMSGLRFDTRRLALRQAAFPRSIERATGRMALARLLWLHRAARGMAGAYDVLVSTFGEADFGVPGIQYVHHPLFADRRLLESYRVVPPRAPGRADALRTLYERAVGLAAARHRAGFLRNLTLTNSRFMQALIRQAYGIESPVLYPSFVSMDDARFGGDDRVFRFLSVGRMSPEKYTLDLVDYYAALHRVFPEAEYVVAGAAGPPGYAEQVQARAEARGVPVRFVSGLSREHLDALLRTSRYYVTPKPFEHFGIATVEAVHAGCLPFVHASGGSTEIVPFPELHFSDAGTLVERVRRVEADAALRRTLAEGLAAHAPQFDRARFYEGLDAHVTAFLATHGRP